MYYIEIMFYKYLGLTLIMLISISCGEKESDSKIIEQRWISDTKIGTEGEKKGASSVLVLKNGIGSISLIGENINERFEYRISHDSIYTLPTNELFFEIKDESANHITISFDGKRRTTFQPINLPELDFERIKKEIVGKSFLLFDEDKNIEKVIYFDNSKVVILPNELRRTTKGFRNLHSMSQSYSIDSIQNIITLAFNKRLKGMKYPILGIIESQEKDILIHSYANKEKETTKLQRISKNNNKSKEAIIGKWIWGIENSTHQIFEFFENGEVIQEKDGIKNKMRWKIDDSGLLITFIEKDNKEKYGVIDLHQDKLRMNYEYRENTFSGLIKK